MNMPERIGEEGLDEPILSRDIDLDEPILPTIFERKLSWKARPHLGGSNVNDTTTIVTENGDMVGSENDDCLKAKNSPPVFPQVRDLSVKVL